MRLRTLFAVGVLTAAIVLMLVGCGSGAKAPTSKDGAGASTEQTKGPTLPDPLGKRFDDAAAAAAELDFTPATPKDSAAGKLEGVWVDSERPKENRPAVLSFDTGLKITACLTQERAIASEGATVDDGTDNSDTMVQRLEQTREPPNYPELVKFFEDQAASGVFSGAPPALVQVNGHDGIAGTRKVDKVTVGYVDWHDGTAFYSLQFPGEGLTSEQLLAIANSMY